VTSTSTLDEERMNQCLYYLKTFGVPKTLVTFYVKHGLLQRACQLVLEKDLGAQIFIEEILQECLTKGWLPQLRKALTAADNNDKEDFGPYIPFLLAACQQYHRTGQLRTLYVIQLFTDDYFRAGLTCIKLYLKKAVDPNDLEEAISYLHKAKVAFYLCVQIN